MTYLYPADRKPRVHKVVLFGFECWEAGRPRGMYLYGQGFHFFNWEDALAYATAQHTWSLMKSRPLEAHPPWGGPSWQKVSDLRASGRRKNP